jgi:hypothetical protein
MRAEDARKSGGDLPDVASENVCGTLARRVNQLMCEKECQGFIVIPGCAVATK